MAANWVASGMSMLPGLAPRPQHHICDKKDHTEEVESASNALFVFVRNCENTKVNVKGKVGKVTLETTKNIELTLDQRVVSGTLEVIKCENVTIRLINEAEVCHQCVYIYIFVFFGLHLYIKSYIYKIVF